MPDPNPWRAEQETLRYQESEQPRRREMPKQPPGAASPRVRQPPPFPAKEFPRPPALPRADPLRAERPQRSKQTAGAAMDRDPDSGEWPAPPLVRDSSLRWKAAWD